MKENIDSVIYTYKKYMWFVSSGIFFCGVLVCAYNCTSMFVRQIEIYLILNCCYLSSFLIRFTSIFYSREIRERSVSTNEHSHWKVFLLSRSNTARKYSHDVWGETIDCCVSLEQWKDAGTNSESPSELFSVIAYLKKCIFVREEKASCLLQNIRTNFSQIYSKTKV